MTRPGTAAWTTTQGTHGRRPSLAYAVAPAAACWTGKNGGKQWLPREPPKQAPPPHTGPGPEVALTQQTQH